MDDAFIASLVPSVIFVVVASIPSFIFFKRSIFQIPAACFLVIVSLHFLSAFLGHQIVFWRSDSIPPLVIGIGISWLVERGIRRLRQIHQRNENKGS